MTALFERLRGLDVYPKTQEEIRVRTVVGGIITFVCGLSIFFLFISELNYYISPRIQQELFVDYSMSESQIVIYFDVTFPNLACSVLALDVMDSTGTSHMDVSKTLTKTRLRQGTDIPIVETESTTEDNPSKTGTDLKCGSCYGAESPDQPCCNTCNDVKKAYALRHWQMPSYSTIEQCKHEDEAIEKVMMNEGCRFQGTTRVSKVTGNFHIGVGRGYEAGHSHVHDISGFVNKQFNTSHRIDELRFGSEFPGQTNPLRNSVFAFSFNNVMFQYYLKVVPTRYISFQEPPINGYQYSLTAHMKNITLNNNPNGLPGIFFAYEFSPIMIQLRLMRHSLAHFLTNVCAIIGGVFTVAGLLDSMLFQANRLLAEKANMGKLF